MSRAEEVAAQFDALVAQDWTVPRNDANPRPLEPPCRCGWPDDKPLGVKPVRVPVLDLSNKPGVTRLETFPYRRTCAACTHPIGDGMAAVVHRLSEPGSVFNRYHPECVDTQ